MWIGVRFRATRWVLLLSPFPRQSAFIESHAVAVQSVVFRNYIHYFVLIADGTHSTFYFYRIIPRRVFPQRTALVVHTAKPNVCYRFVFFRRGFGCQRVVSIGLVDVGVKCMG